MHVLFVTPAFKRYELSRICFEQRVDAINKLRDAGIKADSVVIADDRNLDIAREFDFETVERDNQWLGQRFNDGYQHAAVIGATHAFPIGSDSWCDPQFIIDAARDGRLNDSSVICSRHYMRVNGDGTQSRQIWVPVLQGVSYVVPIGLLQECAYRPCKEEIKRGCDGSAWQSIERAGGEVVWSETHELETVAFESWPQITMFDKLGTTWGVGDVSNSPFARLAGVYGETLTAKIEEFYRVRREEGDPDEKKAAQSGDRARAIAQEVLNTNRVPSAIRHRVRDYVEQGARIALEERWQ